MVQLRFREHRLSCSILRLALLLWPALSFSADYLPLHVGNTWQLHSPNVAAPVTARVASVEQYNGITRARVDIATPWMKYGMLVRSTTAGIDLEGIALDDVRFRFADPVIYFPAAGTVGQTWNSSGTLTTLVSASATISAPAGTFTSVRRYTIKSPDGSTLAWGLAPEVGFVEFGTGAGAFVAQTFSVLPTAAPPASLSPARNCPRVGIAANPAANGDFSEKGKDAAQSTAFANGSRFMHLSTSWAELEPSPNTYNLSGIKADVARAVKFGLDAAATIKTINTAGVSLPADLAGRSWNDPVVLSRFKALLSHLVPVLGPRVRWLEFGNEVDVLLSARTADLGPFAVFVQSAAAHVATLRPDLSTGVVFSGDSYRLNDFAFRVLAPYCGHVAFTYYATRPNPTPAQPNLQRSPLDVPFDVAEMIRAAAGKPLVFTEIGHSSSTLTGSSTTIQQTFYEAVFESLRRSGGAVTAANFFLMSDIPLSVAQADPSVANYVSWYQELGLTTLTGVAKPAWSTFRTQAVDFTLANRCF